MFTMEDDVLADGSAREVKGLLASGRYSVLKSFGANRLRLEMKTVGQVCRFVVWLIYFGTDETFALKRRAARLVGFFFPTTIRQDRYLNGRDEDAALVLYFNHQSLFEVLAAIWYCLTHLPGKRCIFPVNLPWYEALCPVIDKLEGIGIYITPMITPKTYQKLASIVQKYAPEKMDLLASLKLKFEEEYGRLVAEFVQSGDIVAVAPSATRTTYIFPSYGAYNGRDKATVKAMPRTMSAIVVAIMRRKLDVPVDFVPFVATRSKPAGTGLNIWRRHDVYVGDTRSFDDVVKAMRARTLDYECYRELAEYVPSHVKYGRGS